ncbi:MAG: YihA family ribosome biogenesis GTP-binding protein [Chlorobi bacterium]|nr:YihA family ribosome biogenesis GTP-binding protein [Chlorobiota bacterium]
MKKIEFIKSVKSIKDLPKGNIPEVVLCGRSNVGKSTFINTVFGRKGIAKTSSTPGKTQALNYYFVEEKFYVVDLPGFGYAKVPKKEKEIWQKLIADYLGFSKNIIYAFHFIDSRHEPTKLDVTLNGFLRELEIPYIVLLNKIDKLKQSELAKARKSVRQFFPELLPGENLIEFSSTKGIGKKEILQLLKRILF